jgi:hypothetical protein
MITPLHHFPAASAAPAPTLRPRYVRAALALGALALAAGCMNPAPYDPVRVGPYFTPKNHSGDPTLGGIQRVVMLPLWIGSGMSQDLAAPFDEVFVTALQQANRFEVVALTRNECRRRFGVESLSSASALPHELLATLKREFAADAVLFVDLTTYQAYRPITLGLRGKLAHIDGARLMWTFDNVFAADQSPVANAARRHYLHANKDVPADLTTSVLQSPGRFAGYAATAMIVTLPPVRLPPPPVKKGN